MSYLKRFKHTIRDQDMFGYPLPINFNGNDSHNTSIGGFFSILINLFITWYVFINFVKLVNYQGDSIATTYMKLDLKDAGSINYDGAGGQFIFWSLKKLAEGNNALTLNQLQPDPTKKPYLDIKYYQRNVDWNFYGHPD